jgi:acetyltransferase-like isoleucine patch superfamily enzyme
VESGWPVAVRGFKECVMNTIGTQPTIPAAMLADLEAEYDRNSIEFQAWLPKPPEMLLEQAAIQDILRRRAGAEHFGRNCYVARGAQVLTSFLRLGDDSWIAAGAIVRGHVSIGNWCSVNPYAHIAGRVRIGNGVRIAGLASIYGFNHSFGRTDIPIHAQGHTEKGVVINDGCWIGANVLVVDGVNIGAHCVVAGGAVVTQDVPEYSVIGGNPARILRDRRDGSAA